MSLTKFSEFLGTKAGDLSRPNRYRIQFTGNGPSIAGGFDDAIGMMCESIEFPGQNFMSSPDALRYGPPREPVTNVSYAPITATFLCSNNMQEKRWFEVWQSNMMNMNSWEPNYYKDYIGDLRIYQLDKSTRAKYVVDLFEVYPKTITAQPLGNALGDTYHTISVELMYHHWEYAAVDTPDQMHSPLPTSASFGIQVAMKKKAAGIFQAAFAAIGNYQAEQAAAAAKSASSPGDPRGRAPKPPGQPDADMAAVQAAALNFIKGGLQKAASSEPAPGVTPNASDLAAGMAGLAKGATGMQATMLNALAGGLTKSGVTARAGGMSISLGGQFNMRMKTPNMARIRGGANPLSAVAGTQGINMASKLKSMFSGGAGGSLMGGLSGMSVGSMMANAEKMGGKASFGGALKEHNR